MAGLSVYILMGDNRIFLSRLDVRYERKKEGSFQAFSLSNWINSVPFTRWEMLVEEQFGCEQNSGLSMLHVGCGLVIQVEM